VAYSGNGGQRCTVLEITAGRVDVGADISFLLQCPGEKEFLMQLLSCLEVLAVLLHLQGNSIPFCATHPIMLYKARLLQFYGI
jgi:hypothetical protein